MDLNLFDIAAQTQSKKRAPLAERMRPKKIEEVIGQEHIIGKGKLLYRAIKADKLSSLIFYGPPGTGKTTIARVIANTTNMNFVQLNAVTSGVKDIRETVAKAKDSLGMYGKRTILFVDEIHRFNKSQQDALLPDVESGTVILIGATTENPYYEVNKALISRSMVFNLKSIEDEDIVKLIERALSSKEGLGNYEVEVSKEAIEHIAQTANGDARIALNAIELAITTTDLSEDGVIRIDLNIAEECIQKRSVKYEKNGDEHYDTISAFIKSMRGSDPDATTYYLAKMLYAGEDPKFIARRIVILASEDIGNADPNALNVAVSAFNAVEKIGMPEGRIILSQAANYMACAPKSNASYVAINRALKDIEENRTYQVPMHLKDAKSKMLEEKFSGKKDDSTYKYPHDYENNYVKQEYLPEKMLTAKYYNPTENGYEKHMKEHLNRIKEKA